MSDLVLGLCAIGVVVLMGLMFYVDSIFKPLWRLVCIVYYVLKMIVLFIIIIPFVIAAAVLTPCRVLLYWMIGARVTLTIGNRKFCFRYFSRAS